ncbi:MAG: right-handed parallel beta-helix repeat-containing protein [Bacteroidetes bacterium]|nr:right-handed parallel beta-helix repeat-containing protein [Bacteroidota bacterium]
MRVKIEYPFLSRVLFLGLIAMLTLGSVEAAEIYLSPSGNDRSPGTIEQPFKTLEKAQDHLRAMISSGLKEDVTIYLRGGTYTMDKTLVLGFLDTPGPEYSLTFQSYRDEVPVLSSGLPIENWQLLSGDVEGLPEVSRGKVWVADMPAGPGLFRTMFDGEKRLSRARSESFQMPPNTEVRMADSRNVYYNSDRIHLRMLPFNDEIKDWSNLSDIEVFFNPVPWNLNFISLESVDMDNKVAYLAYEANAMPFTHPIHSVAWVENVIDFLDQPGEWCINTQTEKVYYWPENGTPSGEIVAPQLMEYIRVEGEIHYDLPSDVPVENIHFRGITFTHGDRSVWYKNRKGWGIQHDWDTFDYGNAMLRFRGAENCSVEACRFTNSGGSGMRLDLHAQHITIQNNYIDYVGHMGILLSGYGPGTKDVNKNNIITNNLIHHCGEVIWHGHAIFAWQSGDNKITHNYIHDVPRKAIGLCGVRCQILMKPDINFDEASRTIRWHEISATIDSTLLPQDRYMPYLHARNNLVEYNRAERTLLKLNDGSSINISGAGAGNLIRFNYLYDCRGGIRMDDWQNGTTISSNIIHQSGGITHKGVNTIENNMLINCPRAFHFRAYPQQTFVPESDIRRNILYSTSEDFVPNSVFKWGKMSVHKTGTKPLPYEYNMDYNVYWFPGADKDLEIKRDNGIEAHGVAMDPRFVDVDGKDFRIRNRKMADAVGFELFDTGIENFGITNEYPSRYSLLDEVFISSMPWLVNEN